MDEQGNSVGTTVKTPRRRRLGAWLILSLALVAVLLSVAVLALTGRVVPAPAWAVERIEARANRVLAGRVSARILDVDLLVDEDFTPHVRLGGVELFSPRGDRIAVLPEVTTTLWAKPMLSGRIEPRALELGGTRIALRRLVDGSLDVDVGAGAAAGGAALKPEALLDGIDQLFSLPVLKDIETVTVDGMEVEFEDLRVGRVWRASDGFLAFEQDAKRIAIDLSIALAEGSGPPALAKLGFTSDKHSPAANLTAEITDVSARDLAAQSPALAWLGALDAPISGAIRSEVDAEGRVGLLTSTLEIGAGALRPTADTKPVRFDRVRLDMAYDPERAALTFTDLEVDGPALRVRASVKAWLKDLEAGLPQTLIGQVAISELKADPEGVFDDPVTISQGAMDFRLRLDPFTFDLGQLVLVDEGGRISARGRAAAEPEGWAVGVDVAVNEIESKRLMALWPVAAVPKTRAWLKENVATSVLSNVKSAFRLRPGEDPHFALGWEYSDTEVRILKTLPPIRNGAGHASITDYRYTLVVDRGHVVAPAGGDIDVAGSVMEIPDLRIKPAPSRITLKTESTITAALSLLDRPPFQFLTKAGRPVDLAEGRARIETILDLVLMRKIKPKDVDYKVTGKLSNVRSDRLAPGRVLMAGTLDLTASREGMAVSGPATFSGVPVEMTWRQDFGPEHRGKSRVEGTVELSPRALDAFAIALPPGSVRGTGIGQMSIDLERGKPPAFEFVSDLAGLTLGIPAIGWSKAAERSGRLMLRGRLGKPVEVDRMEVEAAGLSVAGNIALKPDGGLDAVRLGTAQLDDWFDGRLELRGRGRGAPVGIVVQSGRLDMRKARFGSADRGQSGAPLSVALDRLQISDGIAVTDFRGNFTTEAGLAGDFIGRVNGEALISGTAEPSGARSGFRIQSNDAGTTLRAAGIFTRAVGGRLDLSLRPVGTSGAYDGAVRIANIRVVDAPVLAALLDAVSVVGLLTQLSGPGILFSNVAGEFHLTPDAVDIRSGAATGPSLGISASGRYETAAKRMDLQGTVSPIYMLNGIGQIFSRQGEGLFGFNYRLAGNADAPRVSVNPLSILTPGMFREIFRSSPPKPSP
ncbi:AsmA-like C-terminal region-containing protein [Defluviimonas sp. WL0024]|uniref:AsmA-like C-terminal region-containing protein n=1 Tax=Albidovulum salinarum TaxID=2984153 RepID=A0ABT2X6Y9_9RHOB|nr:AsmA-like C-terminal region-containing protein [Defluviimonas sp. WL0024]MCU9849722.1 AsmA-like C-terminal region-containing protein [Defluviimonas sp. WL0024]